MFLIPHFNSNMYLSRSVLGALALTALIALPVGTSARTLGAGVQKQLDRLSIDKSSLLDSHRHDNGLHLGQLKQEQRHDSNQEVQVTLTGRIVTTREDGFILELADTSRVEVETEDAKLLSALGVSISLSDLQVHDQVRLVGTREGNEVHARLVQEMSTTSPQASFVGAGVITSLDAQARLFDLKTMSQGTVSVHVGEDTRITKDGTTASWSDLALQKQVQVIGMWDTEHERVHAHEVRIRSVQTHMSVMGRVTGVSTSSLTLVTDAGTSYTVNARNALILSNTFVRLTVNDIRVGDELHVWGFTQDSSSTLEARLIIDTSRSSSILRLVTFADTNGSLQVVTGDRLRLELGQGYQWSVQTSNSDVLARVTDPAGNSQGTYEARAVGEAQLTATGTPTCASSTPACAMPSLSFRLRVNVTAQR